MRDIEMHPLWMRVDLWFWTFFLGYYIFYDFNNLPITRSREDEVPFAVKDSKKQDYPENSIID